MKKRIELVVLVAHAFEWAFSARCAPLKDS